VKISHANGTRTVEAAGYIFENGGKNAEARYHQLSRLYDANTIRHIERRGIDRGWSCLEVGGGGGSIASWLCLRVGVTGRVLATDIDARFKPFRTRRNEATLADYRENIARARFEPMPAEFLRLRMALRGNPEDTKRFVLAREGLIPPEEFFDPKNLERIQSKFDADVAVGSTTGCLQALSWRRTWSQRGFDGNRSQ